MKITLSSFFGISRIMPETYRITSIRRFAAGLCLLTLAALGLAPVRAHASSHSPPAGTVLTSLAAAPGGGFWVQVDLQGAKQDLTLAKDGAPAFGNVSDRGSIASIPGRNGYWVVTDGGQIFARGDAPHLCDLDDLSYCSGFPDIPLSWQIIVGAAATPTGKGLWALGYDGKVWTAGDAQSYGDVQNDSNLPTGIVATPSGKGYYVVLEDGGVYSFGDAVFYGSTGGKKPGGHHVTGMALSINDAGKITGYWLVAADGAVYTFGNAPFWGNAGINEMPVGGIIAFPTYGPTKGYAWVHTDGQIGVVYRPVQNIDEVVCDE
jgi:hypothetical protein